MHGSSSTGLPAFLIPKQTQFTLDEEQGHYGEYSVQTHYASDMGVLPVPLSVPAQDGTTVRYVTVSGHVMQKEVHWQVSRKKLKPQLPSPTPSSSNEVLLRQIISPCIPHQTELDGTTITYVVSGVYIYGLRRPITLADGLPMGTAPTDATPKTEAVLKTTDFQKSLY